MIRKNESAYLLKATEEVRNNLELQAACPYHDIQNAYEKLSFFPKKKENQLDILIYYVL